MKPSSLILMKDPFNIMHDTLTFIPLKMMLIVSTTTTSSWSNVSSNNLSILLNLFLHFIVVEILQGSLLCCGWSSHNCNFNGGIILIVVCLSLMLFENVVNFHWHCRWIYQYNDEGGQGACYSSGEVERCKWYIWPQLELISWSNYDRIGLLRSFWRLPMPRLSSFKKCTGDHQHFDMKVTVGWAGPCDDGGLRRRWLFLEREGRIGLNWRFIRTDRGEDSERISLVPLVFDCSSLWFLWASWEDNTGNDDDDHDLSSVMMIIIILLHHSLSSRMKK